MNAKRSPKRLTVEAVRGNLRRAQDILTERKNAQASCRSSWNQRRELSKAHPDIIKWDADDTQHEKQALAGYEREIADLEVEVKTWEDALSHALDALERD